MSESRYSGSFDGDVFFDFKRRNSQRLSSRYDGSPDAETLLNLRNKRYADDLERFKSRVAGNKTLLDYIARSAVGAGEAGAWAIKAPFGVGAFVARGSYALARGAGKLLVGLAPSLVHAYGLYLANRPIPTPSPVTPTTPTPPPVPPYAPTPTPGPASGSSSGPMPSPHSPLPTPPYVPPTSPVPGPVANATSSTAPISINLPSINIATAAPPTSPTVPALPKPSQSYAPIPPVVPTPAPKAKVKKTRTVAFTISGTGRTKYTLSPMEYNALVEELRRQRGSSGLEGKASK